MAFIQKTIGKTSNKESNQLSTIYQIEIIIMTEIE